MMHPSIPLKRHSIGRGTNDSIHQSEDLILVQSQI
jgi:hypothetical protein